MFLHIYFSFFLCICAIKNVKMFQRDFRFGSHFIDLKLHCYKYCKDLVLFTKTCQSDWNWQIQINLSLTNNCFDSEKSLLPTSSDKIFDLFCWEQALSRDWLALKEIVNHVRNATVCFLNAAIEKTSCLALTLSQQMWMVSLEVLLFYIQNKITYN